jgi:hypothetical protein
MARVTDVGSDAVCTTIVIGVWYVCVTGRKMYGLGVSPIIRSCMPRTTPTISMTRPVCCGVPGVAYDPPLKRKRLPTAD